MMELKEFFEKERMNYLKGFQTVHSMTKEKGGREFEISVEQIDNGEMHSKTVGNPLSFFRYDIIVTSRENGNNYEVKVKTEPTVLAEALVLQEKGVEIRIESFAWNACEFLFSNLNPKERE